MSNNLILVEANDGQAMHKPGCGQGTKVIYESLISNEAFRVVPGQEEQTETNIEELTDYRTTTSYTVDLYDDNDIPVPDNGLIRITTQKTDNLYPFPTYSFDFIAISGLEFEKYDIYSIKIYYLKDNNSGGYDRVYLGPVDLSGKKDFSPVVAYFNLVQTHELIIEIQSNSKVVDIELIYAGGPDQYLQMPNSPGVGFKKASWNNLNSAFASNLQGTGITSEIMTNDGTEEDYNFKNVNLDFMYSEFKKFRKEFSYFPVFSQWNPRYFPSDVIFGRMEVGKSRITNAGANVSFKIQGII